MDDDVVVVVMCVVVCDDVNGVRMDCDVCEVVCVDVVLFRHTGIWVGHDNDDINGNVRCRVDGGL